MKVYDGPLLMLSVGVFAFRCLGACVATDFIGLDGGRVGQDAEPLDAGASVARQLAGERRFITTQSVLDTIGSGVRVADPQGVAGQFMYRSAATRNGSEGTLEVLVHEASGQIRHVLFLSGVAP